MTFTFLSLKIKYVGLYESAIVIIYGRNYNVDSGSKITFLKVYDILTWHF